MQIKPLSGAPNDDGRLALLAGGVGWFWARESWLVGSGGRDVWMNELESIKLPPPERVWQRSRSPEEGVWAFPFDVILIVKSNWRQCFPCGGQPRKMHSPPPAISHIFGALFPGLKAGGNQFRAWWVLLVSCKRWNCRSTFTTRWWLVLLGKNSAEVISQSVSLGSKLVMMETTGSLIGWDVRQTTFNECRLGLRFVHNTR